MDFDRDKVRHILQYPDRHEWQVQGFGMLRTYFGDEVRLQVWDQRLAVWGNNDIHDHPWNFTSTVMAGVLYNQRYNYTGSIGNILGPGQKYNRLKIRPGMEGREWGDEVETVRLWSPGVEVYSMGDEYSQEADELHITRYHQGTVTVIDRERVREEDFAYVCWRSETPPHTLYQVRKATWRETRATTQLALTTWFNS